MHYVCENTFKHESISFLLWLLLLWNRLCQTGKSSQEQRQLNGTFLPIVLIVSIEIGSNVLPYGVDKPQCYR